ncbi:MAG: hypothetical protein MHM6MM_001085 [Cercozoa sp. M6MM]
MQGQTLQPCWPQDRGIQSGPTDTVSALAWMPQQGQYMLAASSWDGKCSVWRIANSQQGCQAQPLQQQSVPNAPQTPILDAIWAPDGQSLFFAGADGGVYRWSVQGNQVTKIGQHDAPVKSVRWNAAGNGLISGGWDGKLRYWDLRSPQPTYTYQCPERVYAMDSLGNVAVVGCAQRKMLIFDLRNATQPFRQGDSGLNYQTRCVTVWPDQQGYCMGSIEGRVRLEHLDGAAEHQKEIGPDGQERKKNFNYRCHRVDRGGRTSDVYPIHAICFAPNFGTFATAGGDGKIHTWDRVVRYRKAECKQACQAPIVAAQFSPDASVLAYAAGYDWGKGMSGAPNPQSPPQSRTAIFLHAVNPDEVTPKSAGNTGGNTRRW